MPFTDPTGGFNAYRNDMLRKLPLAEVSSQGYSFQIEMKHLAWKQGFKVSEIPILFTERREGKSKMSAGIVREALWMVWKLVLKR
jgi:dolichol-phosphate mannosyltransferase